MLVRKGSKIRIKFNLRSEFERYGYIMTEELDDLIRRLQNTEQIVVDFWKYSDAEYNHCQWYIKIEEGIYIPIDACEVIDNTPKVYQLLEDLYKEYIDVMTCGENVSNIPIDKDLINEIEKYLNINERPEHPTPAQIGFQDTDNAGSPC